jgi:hypothetical protein
MTNRPTRKNGVYTIKNKTYKKVTGSRREVWSGTAFKTEGNLEKKDLIQPKGKNGRIVSLKKHMAGKKKSSNNLIKSGWGFAKKGKFGANRLSKRSRRGSRKSN